MAQLPLAFARHPLWFSFYAATLKQRYGLTVNVAACLVMCGLVPGLSAQFVDATRDAGLLYEQMEVNAEDDTVQLMSGGAAAGDYDGDGWVDLFVTRVGAPDILYRNLGPSGAKGVVRFQDATSMAGVGGNYDSNGAAWADIDNDSDLDLYVTTIYHDRFYLYSNQGDGTFLEQAVERGAALQSVDSHNGFSVSFGDYDRDGYLDFHVSEWGVLKSVGAPELHNALMRNRGVESPGFFTNAVVSAGVTLKGSGSIANPGTHLFSAFTSRFNDMDNDGWPDLLVASDYGSSQLFWNNGDGTFVENGSATGIGLDRNGMGSDVGDYNSDGLLDWFVTSIDDNRLYLNAGDRQFVEVASRSGPAPGLTYAGWGWGTSFFDYDNDGDQDLVMTNGYQDLDNPTRVLEAIDQTTFWRNDSGFFNRMSDEMGFTDTAPGKGLLTFDYDNDGDLDVFIVNCQTTPILYRNETVTPNHWLRINLVGRKSNTRGIGARIELKTTIFGKVQIRDVSANSNFLGQSEVTAHFGLGSYESVRQIVVRWPSGRVQTLRDVLADREIRILEPVTYEEWETAQMTGGVQSFGGKENDFDEDGFNNYTEYVFATDPREASDRPELERIRPRLERVESGFRIRYERPIGASDVAFICEVSSDLEVWGPIDESLISQQSVTQTDGDYKWVEATMPEPNSNESWFLRIRAAEPVD